MHGAWLDCLMWAIQEAEIIDAFQKETGCIIPASGGFAKLIDQACGVDETFARTFTDWFNKNIWGDMERSDD